VPEPAEPQAAPRAMEVALAVRASVVDPVPAGETDRVAKEGGREQAKNELETPAGPEGAMGEIAVEPGSQGEEGDHVEDGESGQVRQPYAGQEQ